MRKLTLLLALIVVSSCCLLALASCGDNGETSSTAATSSVFSGAASSEDASSGAVSSEATSSEAASSEEISSEDTSSEDTSSEETSSENGGTTAQATEGVTPSGTNLALNCTYTGADAPDSSLGGDYSASLTDGQAAEGLTFDASWFGYWYNDNAEDKASRTNTEGGVGTIVIDLGSVTAISAVRVNTFLGNSAGINAPKSMKFEYSEDGTNYVTFGEKSFESAADGDVTVEWVGFTLSEAANAQYVRVTVTTTGVCWTFLNEIEVY